MCPRLSYCFGTRVFQNFFLSSTPGMLWNSFCNDKKIVEPYGSFLGCPVLASNTFVNNRQINSSNHKDNFMDNFVYNIVDNFRSNFESNSVIFVNNCTTLETEGPSFCLWCL